MCCDGNEKIIVKVYSENAPKKKRGDQFNSQAPKPYGNGWFMITNP